MAFLAGILLGFILGVALLSSTHRRRLRRGRITVAGESYLCTSITETKDNKAGRVYVN